MVGKSKKKKKEVNIKIQGKWRKLRKKNWKNEKGEKKRSEQKAIEKSKGK